MRKQLKGLLLGVAFLTASFGIFGEIKADTTTEDIIPNVNIIRSLEEKDRSLILFITNALFPLIALDSGHH